MEDFVALIYSATFPEAILDVTSRYLDGACSEVNVYEVLKYDKKAELMKILKCYENGEHFTLVFVNEKRTADFLAVYLSENGFPTTTIHEDRYQRQKEEALEDFMSGFRPTLIVTAASLERLDIINVTHVVNFDLPQTVNQYLDRIERAVRVDKKGKVSLFYDIINDGQIANDLGRYLTCRSR